MKKERLKNLIVFSLFWFFILASMIYIFHNSLAFAESGGRDSDISFLGAWQPGIKACRDENPVPETHYLPLGIGDVKVDRCFNFDHDVLETKSDGQCLFRYSYLKPDERGTYKRVKAKVVYDRHKYICYFKGRGVYLAEDTQIRQAGDKILFQGEEPKNFRTKDPACSELVNEFIARHKGMMGFEFYGVSTY